MPSSSYTAVKVAVAQDQLEKLKTFLTQHLQKKPLSIKIDLKNNGGSDGDHTLLLTNGQIAKLDRARAMGRRATKTIKLSRRQVKANMRHQGGFLGLLAGLAAKALPALAKGLATGLVSGAVSRAVKGSGGGDGLYLFRSGHCIKVDPVKGNGLYLHPSPSSHGLHGDGLYLKRGDTIHNGEGLILGKNSPFKNIPILGWIL